MTVRDSEVWKERPTGAKAWRKEWIWCVSLVYLFVLSFEIGFLCVALAVLEVAL